MSIPGGIPHTQSQVTQAEMDQYRMEFEGYVPPNERKTGQTNPAGDPRFHAILEEIGKLHDKKSQDYGTGADPYANVRASAEFGIPPWVGAVLRANDKTTRIKSFLKKGSLANESLEDSLMDNAVYYIIALILYREQKERDHVCRNAGARPVDAAR